ncbi:MAG: ATP-binding protein [Bacillota bacterium]|nr:ATP-binding protein [Bacillota bacterium]
MKLRNRILGSFILIIAVAVVVMAFTSRIYINNIFDRYAESYRSVVAEQWEYLLKSYYQRQGSWAGVENILNSRRRNSPALRGHMGGNIRGMLPGEELVLTDEKGMVLFDSQDEIWGEVLPQHYLDRGIPLVIDGNRIGTLIMQPEASRAVLTMEEQFSRSVILAVLWGGLAALLAGTVLSFLLTGQISKPLALLTSSAKRFARRDFKHRVQINSKDEVGKLADAFNFMADSIEKNERLRRNLTADVSHELRTPLTILRGNFESLQAGRKPTMELISSLHDEVLRLSRLVSDLESINLAEAGKLPLHYKEVEVSSLCSRASFPFQHEAQEREINFSWQVEDKLESWGMDEDRIMQVLINLLANAFRFTPDRGKILLQAEQSNGNLVIYIIDSGPGISQEDIPFIFERFYKTGRGRGEGSGLGLSIAKSFVEAHGGTISADTLPDAGSIFTFSIPPSK